MAKKKPYRYVLYLLLRAGAGILCLLPRRVLCWLAGHMGALSYYIVTRQRNRALEHLRLAFGREKTEKEIQKLAQKVFRNFALTAADVLQFHKLNRAKIEKLVDAKEAIRVYDELLKEGRGLLSVTAHMGNWELLAGVFGLLGHNGGVIARRIYYEPYNQWIVGLRRAVNVATIYRDDSSREVLKRLKNNEIIGILPDQDIDSIKGIFVDFFGRPAYTPIALVKIALISGAPILPNFLIHKPNGRYEIIVGEVIRPVIKTTRDQAVEEYTALWMKSFEKVIRQYPDQWGWMHNRWKTQPGKPAQPSAVGPVCAHKPPDCMSANQFLKTE